MAVVVDAIEVIDATTITPTPRPIRMANGPPPSKITRRLIHTTTTRTQTNELASRDPESCCRRPRWEPYQPPDKKHAREA